MTVKLYKRSELHAPLQAALEELWVALEARKPYIIVEEVISKRFIQYYGSRERRPILDIPRGQLSSALAPGTMEAHGFRYVPFKGFESQAGSYQIACGSVASGAKWGCDALRGALGFLEDFYEFTIETGGRPMD